jgi:hypothetical protein
MLARELQSFIEAVHQDEEYREARRNLHENYEWIEGYSIQHQRIGDIERFINCFDDYYWRIDEFRDLAWNLASQGCVGKSNDNYNPTQEIMNATMYLLHRAGIGDEQQEVPGCSTMDCIKVRRNLELCDADQRARDWDGSGFKATMYIVRQIRNNLFHGRKIELRPRQYERNKRLIITGEHITALILEYLDEAEQQSI